MGKIVIFDLGGVLVNLDWDRVCSRLHEHSGLADVRPEVVNGPTVTSAMRGQLTPRAYHEALCEKLVASLSYEDFVESWNSLLSANEAIVPLVEHLRSGHRLVLASNTDPIHFAYSVERFPVLKNFERYFLSYEMGLLKPDPAYFHHVLYGLWASPGDCIFIDDRPDVVRAARNIGITGLVFESIGKLKSDLSELSE